MRNPKLHVSDMKLWQRLLLVALTGAVPLFIVSLMLIKATYSDTINFSLQEQRGNTFQRPLEQLLDLLPRYQAAAQQALAGKPTAKAELAGLQPQIEESISVLAANYNGDLGRALQFNNAALAKRRRSTGRLSVLQLNWENLKNASLAEAARGQFIYKMEKSIHLMIDHAADISNLVLDNQLDSYYLVDITVFALPDAQKRINDTLFSVSDWLRNGQVSSNETQIAVMAAMLRQGDLTRILRDRLVSLREDTNFFGDSESLQKNLPTAVEKFRVATQSLIDLLDRITAGKTVTVAEFEAAGWKAHTESFRLWQTGANELDRLLTTRIHTIQTRRSHCYLIIVFTLGLAAIVMGFIIRSLLNARYAEMLKTEEELRAKETRLRALGDNLPDGMVYQIMRDFDGTMRFLYVSAGIERLNGLSAEAVLRDATLFSNQVLEEDQPKLLTAKQHSLANKSVFNVIVRMRRADGNIRWMQLSSTPRRLPDGRFIWDGIETDVTEQKNAEERIQHLNRTYAVLSDINQTIVREKDSQIMLETACRIAVEKGTFRMAWIGLLNAETQCLKPVAAAGIVDGYTDLLNIDLKSLQPNDPAASTLISGEHTICNDIEHDPLYASRRDEALRRGYRASGSFPLKAEGKVIGLFNLYASNPGFFNSEELLLLDELAMDIGFALQVHEREIKRQQAEAILKQSEERFSRIFNNSPIPIAVTRFTDGTVLDINESFLNISGFTREEIIGHTTHELEIYPSRSKRSTVLEYLETYRHLHAHEQLFRTKSGQIRNHVLWLEMVTIGGEKCIIILALDMTEQKQAETALQLSQEKFSKAFQSSPSGMAISDLETGQYLEVNTTFCKIYGCAQNEIVGHTSMELGLWEKDTDRELLVQPLRETGSVRDFELRIRSRNRGIRTVLINAELIEIGGRKCIVTMLNDITERKQAEQQQKQLEDQLRQAQKLEALGTLAGGIAHDFNNILGAIISFTELSKMDNSKNSELQENLDEVLKASGRATGLVRQILSFSRQQKHERKNLQLAPVIKEALKLLRATLPTTIEIQQTIDAKLPDVLANSTQVHQVVMNLCTNAAHAMKGRHGQLNVQLDVLHLESSDTKPHVGLQPGDYVRLIISDTGSGMDEATLKRIFEPFFTTKGPGEGTGLGLSVVHGIVKEHEGVIAVESKPGHGTKFTIFLPARPVTEKHGELDGEGIPRGKGERVLFVDDEPVLGEVAQKMMQRLGYRPVICHSSEAAWAAIQTEPAAYDALISDLTMPVMTGVELARQVLGLRPNLPIILTSGSSGMLSAAEVHEIGIRELVSKPLDYQTLARTLNKVLNQTTNLK